MPQVLYEDNHCLALDKPAGWLVAPDQTGDTSLLDFAREYLREKYQKPGNVFVGLVHRLDRPVSGVVLFARTSKGAARLSEQFRTRTVEKTYQALVVGRWSGGRQRYEDWLLKDEQRNLVQVVSAGTPGAQQAVLHAQPLQVGTRLSCLEVHLETGRSHQIRVQLASRGWPIVGDVKYGSQQKLSRGTIALHAASLSFTHPTRSERITIVSPTPATWPPLG